MTKGKEVVEEWAYTFGDYVVSEQEPELKRLADMIDAAVSEAVTERDEQFREALGGYEDSDLLSLADSLRQGNMTADEAETRGYELGRQSVRRWIPVEERMPEYSAEIQVLDEEGVRTRIGVYVDGFIENDLDDNGTEPLSNYKWWKPFQAP